MPAVPPRCCPRYWPRSSPATPCWSKGPTARKCPSSWKLSKRREPDALLPLASHPYRPARLLPPVQVPDLPLGRGGGDGAPDRLPDQPDADPLAESEAGQGPADPGRWSPAPYPGKSRHADHGRAVDPDPLGGVDPVMGQPVQPLCLDRADGHGDLWPAGLPG